MEQRWDYLIPEALMFLLPGVWFTIAAIVNLTKLHRSLTAVGMVVYLTGGAVLIGVGVTVLTGLTDRGLRSATQLWGPCWSWRAQAD